MTYLVNLKAVTAKGQRRAKTTSPLPNVHFSLVFFFLPSLDPPPLHHPQVCPRKGRPHLPALYYHGTWVVISPGLSPGAVHPAGVHSGVHSVPLRVPIPLSSVPEGTGSSLIAAGRWQEWIRWPKSPFHADILKAATGSQRWQVDFVLNNGLQFRSQNPHLPTRNWARHSPFFPETAQDLPLGTQRSPTPKAYDFKKVKR